MNNRRTAAAAATGNRGSSSSYQPVSTQADEEGGQQVVVIPTRNLVPLFLGIGVLITFLIATITAVVLSDIPVVKDKFVRATSPLFGGTPTSTSSGSTSGDLPLLAMKDNDEDVEVGTPKELTIHDPYSSDITPEAVQTLNSLGLRLFAHLASTSSTSNVDGEEGGGGQQKENVVISPSSIASILSLISVGTTVNSEASEQLSNILGGTNVGYSGTTGAKGAAPSDIQLQVANSAWLTSTVHESYRTIVEEKLHAQIYNEPKDVSEINDWINTATNGTIPTILDEIPQPLVALLINGVYFKASWMYKFDVDDTTEESFYGETGTKVGTVQMMKMEKERFPYAAIDVDLSSTESSDDEKKKSGKIEIVELPYGTEAEYSAIFLVPTKGSMITLSDLLPLFLEDGDNTDLWDSWIKATIPTKLDLLGLPRFKVEYGVASLKSSLQSSLGVQHPFVSDETNPPLSRLTSDPKAYVDDIYHKATIECTEEGTVASAASAAVIMSRSMPIPGPKVLFDRPFLMAIRNRSSGAIMFLGKIDYPTFTTTSS